MRLVVKLIEEASRLISRWFSDNQFEGNPSKCRVLLSTSQQVHAYIHTAQIKHSQYEKLLRVTTDTKLSSKTHYQEICGKGRAKLKALARITPFMNIEERRF